MKSVTCECGHTERGNTEKEILDKMHRHIKERHPEAEQARLREEIKKKIEELEEVES